MSKKVTIRIPVSTLYDLIQLVENSKNTGVEEWDANMGIIDEELNRVYETL